MSTTFKDLSLLKKAQEDVKTQLGNKYEKTVAPFIDIIQMVMKANNFNEFAAMKKIKEELPLYKKPDSPFLFSAALIEITEEKHFQKFKN